MSIALQVKELRQRTGAGMMDCKKALEQTDGDMEAAIKWLRENGIAKAAKKGDRVAAEGLTKVAMSENKAVIFELNSETDFVAKNEHFLTLIEQLASLFVESTITTVEQAHKLMIEATDVETFIANASATIGEKLTLRRLEVVEKTPDQQFVAYAHMGGKISTLLVINGSDQTVAKQVAMHVAATNPKYLSIDEVDQAFLLQEEEILKKEALNEGKPENIVDKMVAGRIRKMLEEICLLEQNFVVDTDKKVKQVLADASVELVSYRRYEVGEGIEKVQVDFAKEVAEQAKI